MNPPDLFDLVLGFLFLILGFLLRMHSLREQDQKQKIDRLSEESVRQDERIKSQGAALSEIKKNLEKIDNDLRELPERIMERIHNESN